jgi:hypothetical protein
MIFIVGDSFSTQDLNFSPSWSTKLKNYFGDQLVNLSYEGASNFGIILQIEKALSHGPSYVVFNSTSSVRHELLIKNLSESKKRKNILDRIINIDLADPNRDMISMTYFKANMS